MASTDMLLLDGDVLAYHACPPRWMEKARIENNISYVELDSKGRKVALEFTQEEDTKYLMKIWDQFNTNLNKLTDKLYCKNYLMAVGGRDNFRATIYDDYKANRHKKIDPKKENIFVGSLRQLAVQEGLAVWADDREADDYLRTWAIECQQANINYIVCSVDKDLKCIPGKYYNLKTEKMETITKESAMRFYYEQLLMGDTTDNIPGLPGIGIKTAKELLADCDTEMEYRKEVLSLYQSFYDDDWKSYLLSNGKMIHIQTHLNDFFNLEGWPV